ncbi:chaperone protein dnaJ 20, chloroplastic-like [Salvia divinorum]|uniref:Chaperone protein dnaJ 20, chloroplastic-like n=1 Tax=Salvia divinorum TaxID=28513 RepID=A0ABD1GVI0_SALDI
MTSVTGLLTFYYREGVLGQRKFGPISCTATTSKEFMQEISALKTTRVDADQLKKAYRKLALRYHPDVCDPSVREESTRMFIELQKTDGSWGSRMRAKQHDP